MIPKTKLPRVWCSGEGAPLPSNPQWLFCWQSREFRTQFFTPLLLFLPFLTQQHLPRPSQPGTRLCFVLLTFLHLKYSITFSTLHSAFYCPMTIFAQLDLSHYCLLHSFVVPLGIFCSAGQFLFRWANFCSAGPIFVPLGPFCTCNICLEGPCHLATSYVVGTKVTHIPHLDSTQYHCSPPPARKCHFWNFFLFRWPNSTT